MRASWVIWVGPKLKGKCPYEREILQEERAMGRGGGACRDAELAEEVGGPSPGAFRGSTVLLRLRFHNSGLQNCERITFHCFKPSSLWFFVLAALGSEYDKYTHTYIYVRMYYVCM